LHINCTYGVQEFDLQNTGYIEKFKNRVFRTKNSIDGMGFAANKG
jgi:hypothetical protein